MVLSQNGRTPLHQAAYNGNLEVVKLLLQSASRTSLNAKDSVSIANNGKFRGFQFLQIGNIYHFAGLNFTDVLTHAH